MGVLYRCRMVEQVGRRERKKQATRQALVEAALRLFEEKGFEQTTVVDIAEAADVSDRTFFLHFPTKEDVLLDTLDLRQDLLTAAGAERGADESPVQTLERAFRRAVDHTWGTDVRTGVAVLRGRLIASNATLQAKLLQRWMAILGELAAALHQAYPDRLDEIEAAGAVGALGGAISAAALTSFQRGDSLEQIREVVDRAIDLALRRMPSLGQ
jgi:AcrR family transcriptional regulator